MIQWIRVRHRIPPPTLKTAEELTVHQVLTRFGVSDHVVYYWIDRRLLQARRLNGSMPYWITFADKPAAGDGPDHEFDHAVSGGASFVAMVQSADLGKCDHASLL